MKSKNLRKYKDEFIKLYKEGSSIRKIAQIYGVSKGSVSRYIREECDIEQRGLSDVEKDKVKKLYSEGLTVNAISKEIGYAYGTVRSFLAKEYGDLAIGCKKYAHLFDDIVKDYAKGLNATQISEKYGVSRQTIMNYIAESDIEARTYSETSRLYELNEDYFDVMDKEKSAILGMIFSKSTTFIHDTSYCIDIIVNETKKEIMDIIVSKLYNGDSPKFRYIVNALNNTMCLRVVSKKLYEKLNKYGVYNTKSKAVLDKLPDVVDEESFWKGFIYASSNITNRVLYISCNDTHKNILFDYLNKLRLTSYRYREGGGIELENKVEVKRLIDEYGYGFIKDRIKSYVESLDDDTKHAWSYILKNKRRPRG